MNSIPLIKGNTPQEINTSIIALKKALDNLQATNSEDLQKRIDEINAQIETLNQHLNTIDGQITDLQPVDTVTSGNMHSVTSNAVYTALNGYNKNQSDFGTAPTSAILSIMDTKFSSNNDYSSWSGATQNTQEGAWYGFKHNNTKGGLCIYMTINNGFIVGKGSGLPSTWTWHRLIMW